MLFPPDTSAVPERFSVLEEFPEFVIVVVWLVLPLVELAARVP